jgi:VCBS repeat protein
MQLYWQIFSRSGFGFAGVFHRMASGNTLLRNRGDGTFRGHHLQGWRWGASFADFDNDGWLDIYAADGWVKNDPGTDLELEFLNNVVSHQDIDKTVKYFVYGFLGETRGTDGNGTLTCAI